MDRAVGAQSGHGGAVFNGALCGFCQAKAGIAGSGVWAFTDTDAQCFGQVLRVLHGKNTIRGIAGDIDDLQGFDYDSGRAGCITMGAEGAHQVYKGKCCNQQQCQPGYKAFHTDVFY